jgi:Protein of unknown function (DUF1592)/Protein of unknown function (DUF1588)/Protein of unknown function (DUF1587)/Protein of unknown function (DUF1585)/Protein of unknown function (DUF1595)/Planctomycete cytochrome C
MTTRSCFRVIAPRRSFSNRSGLLASARARAAGLTAAAIFSVGIFSADLSRADSPAVSSTITGDSATLAKGYGEQVRPLLQKYCFECHSTTKQKGDLDLERFSSLDDARSDVEVWRNVLEMLESAQMPPEDSPQPSGEEHDRMADWTRRLLDAEILARAGDPGRVIVRRLSNIEYNNTIRDLTSLDLRPTRDFPADGAAGEGFTNSGDGLVMSPVLFGKYWNAGKEIASHAVLVPEGFHFSPAVTRADWSGELIAKIRAVYAQDNPGVSDGKLDFAPYLAATIANRYKLQTGDITIDQVAAESKLNKKYLRVLWQTLTTGDAGVPLMSIRAAWRKASPANVDALVKQIHGWQALVWKFAKVGSYINEDWQQPAEPTMLDRQTFKLKPNLQPGQKEVVLHLSARQVMGGSDAAQVIWQRPRFEGTGHPTVLLRDLRVKAGKFEGFHHALFSGTANYLAASLEIARTPGLTVAAAAENHKLDPELLKRWSELAALSTGLIPLERLPRVLQNQSVPSITGWGTEAGDNLPSIVGNFADEPKDIPGHIQPHGMAVHPSPSHFAAIAWTSPTGGRVRIEAKVVHAHPPGGNGVVWWLEHRHDQRADRLDGGTIGSGQPATIAPLQIAIDRGDQVVVAVGGRDGNVNSDLTDVDLTITEVDAPGRVWNLAGNVADTIKSANPHSDKHGNADVWLFAAGFDGRAPIVNIPAGSKLAAWRSAVLAEKPATEIVALAEAVQAMLAGDRPATDREDDRRLFDNLQSLRGPLLDGLDTSRWLNESTAAGSPGWGLSKEMFGAGSAGSAADEASLITAAGQAIEFRVPVALMENYEFVTDAILSPQSDQSIVQLEVSTDRADMSLPARENLPCLKGAKLQPSPEGYAALRSTFPKYLFYSKIVPDDEVIDLRMHFREDKELARLFLNDQQVQQLDTLWADLRYVSQSPLAELKYYSTFMGFVSQDGPEELARVKGKTEEPVRRRGEAFPHEIEELAPAQLEALVAFANQVYRRPLAVAEQKELKNLYHALREKKEMSHEDAWRTTLASLFTSPMFLYRVESAPPGDTSQAVSNFELATRLSYFLWATTPDAELEAVAAAGKLTDPAVLSAQTSRMLKDAKVRGLATEFGTQWLHVRDIRGNREKNEKLFPTFDDSLREALFEESTLFFQHLFQDDRSVLEIFDADYTFANDLLAKHYGIPGVEGPQWRKVEGVKQYGRGGVLGMASVLAAQSGASRTSPVLRGNWLVETLLGEKIPKPPANVPRLPDEETGGENLTVRQMVEKHAHVAECQVCHERIDPYGFALEKYDAIGRLRENDLAGRPIATDARLKDGSQFDGLDGMRKFLVEKRKDLMLRHFCTKLLGYSLGRTVSLSDRPLVDQMIAALQANDYRASAAILPIVESKQFCNHRGMDATKNE